MKRAIVTRIDDEVKDYVEITLPVIKKYADKCGADLITLSHEPPVWTEDRKPHYRALKIYDMFDEYDRILHLDADMLMNKNCPDIFNTVPEGKIGSVYEDVGSRQADRRQKIYQLQMMWGDLGWRDGYTNFGTFVMSKQHRDMFQPHNEQYYLGWGSADLHISYNIHKYNMEVHELSYHWNHMTMFSESWNQKKDRFNSFIIHYGGRGVFDIGVNNKTDQIKLDYKRIYE